GFVSYSIRPKAGLALGTKLENFADIYFDYNDPVRTNTTLNTLWQPTYTPGILDTVFVTATKKTLVENDISFYPNPSKGKLEVNVPEAGVLQLYNTKGETVLNTRLEAGQQVLNFSQLSKGLYLLQFRNSGGQVSKKVILE
ncbi:MAG TPA: T9SS type A sorting domain-containing protein, partial [Catalimonadaceae bacterium]|nr:T9SS type A sorting domain-containing protein [Catalimonadaceae bacterium]